VRHSLPSEILTTLVTALVISQIRYCISVYGNSTQENTNRVQKIINFAAKMIFGRKKFNHASDLIEELGWLRADELASYHTLTTLHKIRRQGVPEELADLFRTVGELREREVPRRGDDIHVTRWRTEMGRRRFRVRAPLLHNALPPEIRELPVSRFGRALKRHIVGGRE